MMRTAGLLFFAVLCATLSVAQEKSGAEKPVVRTFVAPAYPRLARDARFQGTAVAELSIERSGAVTSVRIVSSHPLFTKYVEQALERWRFMPVSAPQQLVVTVRFEINDCVGCIGEKPVAPEVRVSAELPDLVVVATDTECTCISTSQNAQR